MPRPTDTSRRTGPALEKAYQFVLWLTPTAEKFPRSQMFLLADRVRRPALAEIGRPVEIRVRMPGR